MLPKPVVDARLLQYPTEIHFDTIGQLFAHSRRVKATRNCYLFTSFTGSGWIGQVE